MEITYLKSLNPIELVEKPTKETIELVAKLVNNPKFKEFIKLLRTAYKFPDNGLDLKPFVGKNFDDLPIEKAETLKLSLNLFAGELITRMNLNPEFLNQLYLLVFFNSFIDLKYFEGLFSDKVDYAVTKKESVCKIMDYKHEVATFIIPYNIKYEEFKRQTRKLWNTMQDEMDEHLSTDPFKIKLHENTELAMKITRLKEEENMTFKQITEKLYSESDGKNEKLSKEEYIKDVYFDYKKLWNSPLDKQSS
ncbi:hypothetical protein GYA27_04295 [candidate division WWE3 bacterium]|uniref:Uncharacterized protein n=1 Tax=candidate division WWE3 bacterium TaxID=2053526 RepID=A0A7X9DL00_UNCKA|nr:hypothetical protein [candidate division WWE3 bacterium]